MHGGDAQLLGCDRKERVSLRRRKEPLDVAVYGSACGGRHAVLDLARAGYAELATAPLPKLVVCGGHSTGFEAICDDVAAKIGAAREVITGAGHEVQFTGKPLNDRLLELWRGRTGAH